MQTPISPLQLASASPAGNAPKAAAPAPEQHFQRTLSRQIEQRQALTQSQNQAQARSADARTKADARANAAAPSKTAAPAAQPAAPAVAKPAEAGVKPDAKSDANTADDQDDVATQPLSDMLTLVASLQQVASASTSPTADGQLADAGSAENRSAAALLGAAAVSGAASAAASATASGAASTVASDKASDKAAAALLGSDKAAAALLTTESDSFDAKLAASALPAAALPKTSVLDDALPGTANPTAQAALQITQAASAVTTGKLNGQVGSPAWDQQLGQKVIWMAAGGMQSATLTLNPPDLGPLQVVLNVSNDQATINFTSNQPEVRQALEAAMPKLREMMDQAGVSLGNTSVSDGNANQDRASTQQERARPGGAAQGGDSAMAQAIHVPAARGAALQGMVDTFA